mmetsp:Transcript_18904/g.28297  ORF Transcript_18904/g.28297 Transcript_18904/m.28297 type:complete len:261 (+) Transcript_18904:102-884(+)
MGGCQVRSKAPKENSKQSQVEKTSHHLTKSQWGEYGASIEDTSVLTLDTKHNQTAKERYSTSVTLKGRSMSKRKNELMEEEHGNKNTVRITIRDGEKLFRPFMGLSKDQTKAFLRRITQIRMGGKTYSLKGYLEMQLCFDEYKTEWVKNYFILNHCVLFFGRKRWRVHHQALKGCIQSNVSILPMQNITDQKCYPADCVLELFLLPKDSFRCTMRLRRIESEDRENITNEPFDDNLRDENFLENLNNSIQFTRDYFNADN